MDNKKAQNHVQDYEHILENISVELHPFIHEHHQTWGLMQKVREIDIESNSMDIYCQALKVINYEIEHHFKQEEILILTRLSRYFPNNEVGPVAKLISEHQSIESKYQEVHYLIENGQKSEELVKQIKLLAYLVMKHIEKEDHYFYPMVSQILNNKEKTEILDLLGSIEK